MIRGILYWFLGPVVTLVMMVIFFVLFPFIFPFIGNVSDFSHRVSRYWAKFLLNVICNVKIDVLGIQNIDSSKNYIIVSNHRSYTDILVATVSIPLQFRWLSKKSLFRIPLIGIGMKIIGHIPIEREKSRSATRSLEKVKEVLIEGRSVWIFPEGTRTPKRELGRFKRGAFYLAKETKKPLLPVVLINTDKIFYKPYIIKGTRVKVIILNPFYYGDLEIAGIDEKKIMEDVASHMHRIIQLGFNAHAS